MIIAVTAISHIGSSHPPVPCKPRAFKGPSREIAIVLILSPVRHPPHHPANKRTVIAWGTYSMRNM